MSFLQPWLLAALPLVAVPVIIHLINQWRYQTIRWGAMMFLLAANRMSRGYARLRQWLIMAFRMLAIAGLVVAVSRPLAGGRLGLLAGGRASTTIILLDRSPSMQQRLGTAGRSKLESGGQRLVETLKTLGSERWVLVDSVTCAAREMESPADLLHAPSTGPASAAADLPAMLQSAHDWIVSNKTGRTEVWICSDCRENDWAPESGRWQTLREAFLEFPQGVRFHLLAYPQAAAANAAVRVTDVHRRQTGDEAELLVSLKLSREGDDRSPGTVPVQFELDGARSELAVEIEGAASELKEHRLPLPAGRRRGWGRISIPADANPADDDFYFAFDEPVLRRTVIVAEDEQRRAALELSAAIPPNAATTCRAEVIEPDQLSTVEWENTALLLWQGRLPKGEAAQVVRAFVERGGYAIFFPPSAPSAEELLGVRWGEWHDPPQGALVGNWRGDQDLLAHTASGAPLPVGQLQIRRYGTLTGEFTPLATLSGGAPLLARAASRRGGIYFCSTTPATGDSSLATDGVVLYVLVQRALAAGASALESTRQLIAGDDSRGDAVIWERIVGTDEAVSTEYRFQRGVYVTGEQLVAVNRSAAEDQALVLDDKRVAALFQGLDFARIDDSSGGATSVLQEIWRLFLASMMVALIVEA
ncbi:MAG: hypothetical protein EXS05_21430, partial [Planctomycetaceae bacterium]|nr:hypothetical protein [Planctomycetaceae bacterium]